MPTWIWRKTVNPHWIGSAKNTTGLILSDWEMQPMSGEQFLTEIGRRFRKIPVILISATAGRGTSCVAGASAFLAKPFSLGDFEAAVKIALRKI